MQNITKRIWGWAVSIVLLLLIPLALTIRDGAVEGVGWNWTPSDFVFAFVVIFGSGMTYELVSRRMSNNRIYKLAVGLAVFAALLLVWINAAVGIIGDDEWPNIMYFGVLFIGMIGAAIARLQPHGMSRALFAMATAQMLVPIIALFVAGPIINSEPPGLAKVFIINAFFAMLFAGAALLFRNADETTKIGPAA